MLAQLGERNAGSVEVRGSNPLRSTIFTESKKLQPSHKSQISLTDIHSSISNPNRLKHFSSSRIVLVCESRLNFRHKRHTQNLGFRPALDSVCGVCRV